MSKQRVTTSLRVIGVASALLVLVAGCGGGGGSGGGGGTGAGGTGGGAIPGGGSNTTSTYLFYTNSDNSFNAIDPAAPGTVIPVVAASATAVVQDLTQVVEGTFTNAGTGAAGSVTVSDLHTDSWVFENTSTNVLDKVNAIKGGSLTQVRLSSASFPAGTATAYCPKSLQVFPDYQTVANSLVIYKQAGADSACGTSDDTVSYTTLGANATTLPTTITLASTSGVQVLKPLYNLTTGAISGALVLNQVTATATTTNLLKTDATLNLATATTVASGLTLGGTVSVKTTNVKGQMLLTYNSYLYAYDPSQPAVAGTNPKQLGTTLFPNNLPFLSDGTNAFFLGNAPAFNVLNRVPLDGSALPTVVYTAPSTETLNSPWQNWPSYMLTANRVVFGWYDGTNNLYGIGSVLKSASNATTATVLNPTVTSAAWSLHSVAGTGVNFGSGVLAYHVNEDGTGLVTPTVPGQLASYWDGRICATTMALDQNDGSSTLRAVMLATTLNATGVPAPTNNVLAAYDVASGIQTAIMGTIPYTVTVASGAYLANNYSTILAVGPVLTAPNAATSYTQGLLLNTSASASSVPFLPDPSLLNQNFVGQGGG